MRSFAVFMLMFALNASWADAQVRMGVVGSDSETGDISNLLEVVFSQDDSIELVERVQLKVIAEELSVVKWGGHPPSLLAADYLVFVERLVHADKESAISFRMVSQSEGVVLWQRIVPDSSAIREAENIGAEVLTILKAKRLSPQGSESLVSLSGMRFDTPTTNGSAFEFAFNQLLTARLMAQDGVSVAERWKVGDLLWEQGLLSGSTVSLEPGTALVGGSIREQGDQLRVTVNFRRLGEEEIGSQEVVGKRSDLASLVGRVAESVLKDLAVSVAPVKSDFAREAERYRQLAEWALGVSLAHESLASAQVAYSLDPENPKNRATLIRSHLYNAWPINIENDHVGNVLNFQDVSEKEFDWSSRLASALNGLDLWLESVGDEGQTLTAPPKEVPVHSFSYLGLNARTPVVWLMRKAIDEKRNEEFAPQLRELQEKYASVISHLAKVDDPDFRWSVISANLPWVAYWSATPEASVENARRILALPIAEGTNRLSASRMVWGMQLEQEFLPSLLTAVPGRRIISQSLHPEILVSNSDDTREAILACWKQFSSDLLQADGYQSNFDGALLHYYLNYPEAGPWPAAGIACDTVWKHRALFASFSNAPAIMQFGFCFEKSTGEAVPEKYQGFNKRFLDYLLTESNGIGTFCLSSLASKKVDWSGVSRSDLAAKFESYRERLNVPERIRRWHLDQINAIESSLQDSAPEPENTSKFPELTLSDCFHPFQSNYRLLQFPSTGENVFAYGESALWCIDKSGLYEVDPKALRAGGKYPFPGEWGSLEASLAVFPNAVYVTAKDGIWKMGRSQGGKWEKVAFPGNSLLKLSKSGSRLYVLFGPKRGAEDEGKGIAEIHLADDSIDVLASSRREPPLHSLDGRADLDPFAAIQQGERTAVSFVGENEKRGKFGYFLGQAEEPNSWSILKGNLAFPVAVQDTSTGSLLCLGGRWSGNPGISQIGFFPHSGEPSVFLAATTSEPMASFYSDASFDDSAPRFILPESIEPTRDDVASMVAATYDGENLILISCDRYQRGSVRDGKQNEIRAAANHRLHVISKKGDVTTRSLRFEGSGNLREQQLFPMTESEVQCFEYPAFLPGGVGLVNGDLLIAGGNYKSGIFGFWRISLADVLSTK